MNASLVKFGEVNETTGRERQGGDRVGSAPRWRRSRAALVLLCLLAGFCFLQATLPLATAIKIGADEDFALSKAFLSLKGYTMYSDYWNDQPPLHTFLLKSIFQHLWFSVLAARLLTIAFTLLLLSAVFILILRVNGLLTASLATALLIASPGFLELSASAMVELPGLAPVVAALCLLYAGPGTKWRATEILAGVVFAVALQIKLIGVLYLPLAALILWLRHRSGAAAMKQWILSGLCFGLTMGIGFLLINTGTGESLSTQLAQSRASHFSIAQSHEYGSPADHRFDWSVPLKNWDTTLPALVGVLILIGRARTAREAFLPLAWLVLIFAIFTTYKPWWTYYYVHTAIPLCWCAAVAIAAVLAMVSQAWGTARGSRPGARGPKRRLPSHDPCLAWSLPVLVALYAACAVPWMAGRLYLQAADIRNAPRTYNSMVLREIERYQPFTDYLFTTEAVYSFHTGTSLPPKLATLSLKRFWSGDMTNAKVAEEMRRIRPGILLLPNDAREVPFQHLLHHDYRLVYQDAHHRLYVLPGIIEQADPWPEAIDLSVVGQEPDE